MPLPRDDPGSRCPFLEMQMPRDAFASRCSASICLYLEMALPDTASREHETRDVNYTRPTRKKILIIGQRTNKWEISMLYEPQEFGYLLLGFKIE